MSLIQLRRDTAANWTSVDPVLSAGEIGVEVDTNKFKLGDGTTAWSSLPYQGVGWQPPTPSTHNFITHDGTSWVMTSMTPMTGDVPYFNGSSWSTTQPAVYPSPAFTGDVITYNGTNWVAQQPSGGLPSGTSPQLLYHDGTNWTATSLTPGSNDVLYWTGSAWGTTPMSGLGSGTTSGDVLTWNGTSWGGAAPAVASVNSYTGAVSLSYSDVGAMQSISGTAYQMIYHDGMNWVATSMTPSNGDVLTFNGSAWTSGAPTGGGPSPGTNNGDVLTWNGASWTSAAPVVQSVNSYTGAVSLSYSDVGAMQAISGSMTGDVLTWNGSSWTASQPAGAAVTSVNTYTGAVTLSASDVGAMPMVTGASSGDILIFSAGSWTYGTPNLLPTPGSANDIVYWTGSNWATQPLTSLLPSISSGYVLGYDSMTGWQGYALPVGLPGAMSSGQTAVYNGMNWVAQKLNANDVDWSTVPTSPGAPGTLWNNSGILQIA